MQDSNLGGPRGTSSGKQSVGSRIAIGWALAIVNIVMIPIDGASVNPARSFGPAIFTGGEALSQIWVYILAPLIGGLIAALIWQVIRTDKDEVITE